MSPYAPRRQRVLAALDGVMVLPAAPMLHRSRDTEVPYRADSDVFYLSGLTEPESVVVLAPEADDGPFILFVRGRDPEAERWSGPRLGPEAAAERFGADAAYPIEELDDRLGRLLRQSRSVHYRMGASDRTDRVVTEALHFGRGRGARTGSGVRSLHDPGLVLDPMRLIKDAHEIGEMRAAAEVTVASFRRAIESIRPGMGEWEIEALLDGGFRSRGATRSAFETIVGSGANGCVLHYVTNGDVVGQDDLVLMDAGAELRMYAADITRTVPASGRFSARQRAVHEVVDRARRAAIDVCRPGASAADVHDAAIAVIADGLVELGVLDGPAEELVDTGAYKAFFPHQTSHWLGLDVHDVGDYASPGPDGPIPRALEPGMVLTIEPGLYFPEDAGVDPSLQGIGVRLEDDVLITEEGCDVLTADLPVSADDIEGMMA